jgi:hypothetical protein
MWTVLVWFRIGQVDSCWEHGSLCRTGANFCYRLCYKVFGIIVEY